MATAGDRMFGPNGCSGITTGNGTIVNVSLDFSPQYVIAINASFRGMAYWFKGMDPGWAWIVKGFLPDNAAVSESVPVVADVANLTDSPSVIESIYVNTGAVTGVFSPVASSVPLATGLAHVDSGAGTVTFFAADAVTLATFTYTTNQQNQSIIDFESVNGISPGSEGFSIGSNAFINTAGQNIYWIAGR